MKKLREKTAIVQLRLVPALKEAAQVAAKADNRTLTGLIEKLLTQHVEATRHTTGARHG